MLAPFLSHTRVRTTTSPSQSGSWTLTPTMLLSALSNPRQICRSRLVSMLITMVRSIFPTCTSGLTPSQTSPVSSSSSSSPSVTSLQSTANPKINNNNNNNSSSPPTPTRVQATVHHHQDILEVTILLEHMPSPVTQLQQHCINNNNNTATSTLLLAAAAQHRLRSNSWCREWRKRSRLV